MQAIGWMLRSFEADDSRLDGIAAVSLFAVAALTVAQLTVTAADIQSHYRVSRLAVTGTWIFLITGLPILALLSCRWVARRPLLQLTPWWSAGAVLANVCLSACVFNLAAQGTPSYCAQATPPLLLAIGAPLLLSSVLLSAAILLLAAPSRIPKGAQTLRDRSVSGDTPGHRTASMEASREAPRPEPDSYPTHGTSEQSSRELSGGM